MKGMSKSLVREALINASVMVGIWESNAKTPCAREFQCPITGTVGIANAFAATIGSSGKRFSGEWMMIEWCAQECAITLGIEIPEGSNRAHDILEKLHPDYRQDVDKGKADGVAETFRSIAEEL